MNNKLSKKDTLIQLLNHYNDYLICPFCNSTLNIYNDSLHCKNNHTFNINKKGYLFLNTINNLHTSNLYNENLFIARRNVIESGIYNKIHEEIIKIINNYNINAKSIIDIGCGEATHLKKIINKKEFNFKFAFDLSKPAISLASNYVHDGIIPSISDVEKIPIKDNSIDIIIDFLSPMSLKECFRILNKDGLIIKIMPTNNYLKEIRETLKIKNYDNEETVENNIINKHTPIYKTTLEYKEKISKEISSNLLKMTPLTYHKDISNIELNEITISLKIIVLKNK